MDREGCTKRRGNEDAWPTRVMVRLWALGQAITTSLATCGTAPQATTDTRLKSRLVALTYAATARPWRYSERCDVQRPYSRAEPATHGATQSQ